MNNIASWLIRHAGKVCALFAVITAIGAWQAMSFEIDASAETLLVKDNRLYLESRQYNQRFAPEEFILVGYRPHSGNLFTDNVVEEIDTISNELATLERVETVNAITNVPLVASETDLSLDSDFEQLSWQNGEYDSEQLRAVFTDHPVYTNLLVNEAQTATALQIVFRDNPELVRLDSEQLSLQQQALEGSLNEEQEARLEMLTARINVLNKQIEKIRNNEIDQIYSMLAPYEENADIYLGGNYVLAFHLVEIITQDLVIFGLAILGIISIVLLVVFRDWRLLLLPLLCCAVSVILTTGAFAALGLKTTVISSNFIALQLILSLAIVIHLIVHYQHLKTAGGTDNHHQLLAQTVSEKAMPCFFAGITTSVGFASLLISNLQPVITFGWMMIVAMATSIVTSLVLFPSVLSLFDTGPVVKRLPGLSALMESLHNLCTHHGGKVSVVVVVITLGVGLGIFRLDAENSFINYFSDDTQIHEELVFIDRELGGSTPLDVIYHPRGEDQESQDIVLESQRARTLQGIQGSLEQSRAVGKVMSAVNFTRLARELNNDQPLTEYELNSLYTLIDSEIRETLLGSYVDESRDAYRVNARIVDSTADLDRKNFLAALRTAFSDMGIAEEDYTLTNLFVLYQDILERLLDSQINTMALVYAALWLVMLCIFRSFKVASIALIPNILVTVFILGLMGLLGIPLDLMTITIAAIAMGIAVDDTIHFVHHYRTAETGSNEEKLHIAYRTVGYAMLYTSMIIALGFGVLGFSDFVPSIVFGLLTAVAMLVALITDLTLLPALLHRFVR